MRTLQLAKIKDENNVNYIVSTNSDESDSEVLEKGHRFYEWKMVEIINRTKVVDEYWSETLKKYVTVPE